MNDHHATSTDAPRVAAQGKTGRIRDHPGRADRGRPHRGGRPDPGAARYRPTTTGSDSSSSGPPPAKATPEVAASFNNQELTYWPTLTGLAVELWLGCAALVS